MRTFRTASTDSALAFYDFGVVDSKGRKVGARVLTSIHTFVEDSTVHGAWSQAPGTYFAFCTGGARNGEGFGVSGPWHYFTTDTARAEAIQTALKAAKARALKSFVTV